MDSEVLTLLLTARYVGSPAFNSLAKDIDTLTSKAGGLAKTGAAISAVGTGITALTVALGVGVGESIKYASRFQNEMNRVWTVVTDGGKNAAAMSGQSFSQLEAQILQTSDKYGQSADAIAQGTYFIMSALGGLGYKAQDVINSQIIPAFGAFVTASGNGLSGAVDWVTGAKQVVHILGAMHEPISQWANDLGVLTAAENNSSLSQANLVQGLTKLAPYAKLLGIPFKSTVGLISAEAEAGIYGSRAGTEAASAYRLLFTSPAALKALTTLGLTRDQLFQASGSNASVLDPGTMFALLQGKLQGVKDPAQRIKLASALFGAVGYRGLGPLMQQYAASNLAMGGNPTYYQAIMSKINGSGLASMLGVSGGMMNTFSAQVARLATAFHNFLLLLGGPLIQALTPVVKKLADALSNLNNALINLGQKNGGGAGGLLAGLGKGLGWLPGAAFGTLGAGALLGPGMTYGGGLLRDWALKQDKSHTQGMESWQRWQEMTSSRGAAMEDSLFTRLSFFDERIKLAQKMANDPTALAKRAAELARPGSSYFNELGRQRIAALEKLGIIPMTQGNQVALRGPDPKLQRLLRDYYNPKGGNAGFASRRAWDYLNTNWDSIAKAYNFDPAKGPNPEELRKLMEAQPSEAAANRIKTLRLSRSQAEKAGREAIDQFYQNAGLREPKVPQSASQMVKDLFSRSGKGIWHLGHILSPFQWMQGGMGRFFPHLPEHISKGWFGGLGRFGDFFGRNANALDRARPHLANFFNLLPGRIGGGIHSAAHFINNFDTDTWPKWRHAIATHFHDLTQSVVDSVKNFGSMVKHGAITAATSVRDAGKWLGTHTVGAMKAVGHGIKAAPGAIWNVMKATPGAVWSGLKAAPGLALRGIKAAPGLIGGALSSGASLAFGGVNTLFKGGMNFIPKLVEGFKNLVPMILSAGGAILSFGSVLLPIVAIALLVAGAVVALVLVFTRYRKEAAQVGAAILKGLAPIFKMFMGVVTSTLGMIGKTWDSHKKQVDAAMKGLLQAFKAATPFFQVVFGIIAGVLAVVVRVIGYLVSAFLDALPHIIKFFSAIFKMLGDLGNIVQDVIHGNWGKAWKDAQALLGHAWEAIQQLLKTLGTFIAGVFKRLWADIGPTVTKLWNGLIAALPGIWQAIQNFFKSIPGWLGQFAGFLGNAIGNLFKTLGPKVGPALSDLWNNHLLPFFQGLGAKIGPLLGTALGNLGQWILNAVKNLPKGGASILGNMLGSALPGIANVVKTIGPKILPALGAIMGFFLGIWKTIFTKLPPLLGQLWNTKVVPFFKGLPAKLQKVLELLQKKWDEFWKVTWPKKIQPALDDLWNKHLLPFFQSLPGKIGNLLQLLWTKMQEFWKTLGPKIAPLLGQLWNQHLLPFFQSLPGKVIRLVLTLIPKFGDFIRLLGRALDTVLVWLWSKVILPFFQSLPGKIISAIQTLSTLMFNFFKGLGQKAVDGIKQGMSGMGAAIKAATANIPVVGGAVNFFTHHRASGGYNQHPIFSWVGEKGPELMLLPGGTRVYSHHDSMAMTRPLAGGNKMVRLHIAALHVDEVHGLEHLNQPQQPGKIQRTTAEEFLFARNIQRQREAVWDRYPNSSRDFDNTYRRAYQYYG